MVGFRSSPIEVVAPASSANLGPGFDSFGLALSLSDRVRAQVIPAGLVVDVSGVGAAGLPRDETHLVVRAMRATFDRLGGQPPGLAVRCVNLLPHAKGLGSSSAAIVAGIVAARALTARGAHAMSDTAALALAAELEGHPDNVAAALLGGLTIAWADDAGVHAARLDVDVNVDVVAFVPPEGFATHAARDLLPAQVSHVDAARNAARAGLLVAALQGRPELLLSATEDWLHQRYRGSAMPTSLRLVSQLRQAGVPAVISGAGPSVLALGATGAHEVESVVPLDWQVLRLHVDAVGARVISA